MNISAYCVRLFRIMFRVALLVVATFTITTADSDGEHKCMKLAHLHSMHCCKKEIVRKGDHNLEELKECFDKQDIPPSCASDICMAKKKGYASDDGIIDKKALQTMLEKDFENEPQLVNNIKEKCVNGNLDAYGPLNICDLTKLRHCVTVQFIKACPEWDDKGPCSGMPELVEECMKKFT